MQLSLDKDRRPSLERAASNSVFTHTNSNANLALKIGLATNSEWLAVAIYGRSSLHPLSEHARVGLGVMHL